MLLLLQRTTHYILAVPRGHYLLPLHCLEKMSEPNSSTSSSSDATTSSSTASAATAPHPILHSSHTTAPTQAKRPKTRKLVWDEENLAENEANKSATMKIDEPPTPYHAPVPVDDEEDDSLPTTSPRSPRSYTSADASPVSSSILAEAVQRAAELDASPVQQPHQYGEGLEELQNKLEEAEHQKFSSHRASHYDEFRRLQELRKQALEEEEEEDDEDDDDE